jgi:hypothetical protein
MLANFCQIPQHAIPEEGYRHKSPVLSLLKVISGLR